MSSLATGLAVVLIASLAAFAPSPARAASADPRCYDDASRLTSISYAKGATQVGELTYTYDVTGRRTTAGGSLARTSLPAAVGTTTHNAANQLTKWANNQTKPTYDANGNMLADGTYTYVWNARGELVQVKTGNTVTASFTYDALGRRIGKTVTGTTTKFASDGANFIQEQNAAGTPTANLLTGGTDQTFSRTDAAGARSLLTDALGSTVGLTDAAGVITTSYTYEPYGKTTVTGTASANTQQFTGRENDGPLYYYRARYLHPTFGRFISADPAGFAAGDPNLYAYVGGDPIGRRDPSGLFGLAGCGLGVVGYLAGTALSNWVGGRRKDLLHGATAAGAIISCAAGALGGWAANALGKGELFASVAGNAAVGLAANVTQQVIAGRRDPVEFLVATATAGGSGAVGAGGLGQGLIVAGTTATLEVALQEVIDELISGFWRSLGRPVPR